MSNWLALGAFVQKRRHELGLSIKAAATTAGASTTWWRQLEAGQRRIKTGEIVPPNVRGDYLGRAALVLDVSLDELKAVLESAD